MFGHQAATHPKLSGLERWRSMPLLQTSPMTSETRRLLTIFLVRSRRLRGMACTGGALGRGRGGRTARGRGGEKKKKEKRTWSARAARSADRHCHRGVAARGLLGAERELCGRGGRGRRAADRFIGDILRPSARTCFAGPRGLHQGKPGATWSKPRAKTRGQTQGNPGTRVNSGTPGSPGNQPYRHRDNYSADFVGGKSGPRGNLFFNRRDLGPSYGGDSHIGRASGGLPMRKPTGGSVAGVRIFLFGRDVRNSFSRSLRFVLRWWTGVAQRAWT